LDIREAELFGYLGSQNTIVRKLCPNPVNGSDLGSHRRLGAHFPDPSFHEKAMTRGHTAHFSNICLLWPWTFTYELHLRTWPSQYGNEPACRTTRSKVV